MSDTPVQIHMSSGDYQSTGWKTRLALWNGRDKGRHCVTFSRLPFKTGPSLKLSIMLVGVMPVFRHMLKVPNAGPLSAGSFGHIGIIEIGIC